MQPDAFPVKVMNIFILGIPGETSAVVRIRKAAKAGLVTVVYQRRTGEGHLQEYRLPQNRNGNVF